MPLFIIGLGLFDEKDVTIRGLELIKKADHVYLESYTSILLCDLKHLESYYGKSVIPADRTDVEGSSCDAMIEAAKDKTVAFLVVGDPFCATTHADLVLRAIKSGVRVQVIHNASIMNAVAECGLQVTFSSGHKRHGGFMLDLYSFGETVSIPLFTENWRPSSFYDKIAKNRRMGLHTLCLLDIKVKEQTPTNMMKGNNIYEPPKYMTISEAIQQLFEIEEIRSEGVGLRDTKAFGIARMGSFETQHLQSGTLEELCVIDFGKPLHSLVICAPELHEIEEEFFQLRRRPQFMNACFEA